MSGTSGWSGTSGSGTSGWSGISISGPTGPGGPAGSAAIAFDYLFDGTSNADTKPGIGYFRLNTATQNAAGILTIDVQDISSNDTTPLLDSLDDSSSTIKGQLRLTKRTDTSKWLVFNLTLVTLHTGFRSLILSIVAYSSTDPFVNADEIVIDFSRTGDQGVTGPTGSMGVDGASGYSGVGTSGYSGKSGFSGGFGPTGPTGIGVTGPTGGSGPTGPTGTGSTGPTGPQGVEAFTTVFASPLNINVSNYSIFDITLTGNITVNFSGGIDGQPISLRVRQDSAGSHLISFGSMVRYSSDLQSLTLSIAPYALDYITLRYNFTDNKYDLLAFNRGFS